MLYEVDDLRLSEEDSSVRIAPWEKTPYDLITWWDMQQFSAGAFYYAGSALERLKNDCLLKPGPGKHEFHVSVLYAPLDPETHDNTLKALAYIEDECRKINLRITADTIKDIRARIERSDEEEDRGVNYQWLRQQLHGVHELLQREMQGKFFVHVLPDRAVFWPTTAAPNLFGERVAKAFPSAAYDINQAGVALATYLSTASVFHLMRIMEIGLGALGSKFGVSLAHTNWAPAIEEIERKIRDMRKDPKWQAMQDCKEQQEFYAQAASHFGILKDAWRNYTMHSRAKYTEQEAEQIFNSVKAFTQKLAERLSE